jgi:hypothetical protein
MPTPRKTKKNQKPSTMTNQPPTSEVAIAQYIAHLRAKAYKKRDRIVNKAKTVRSRSSNYDNTDAASHAYINMSESSFGPNGKPRINLFIRPSSKSSLEYQNLTPASSIMDYQKHSRFDTIIEVSGVDRNDFMKHLNYLNQENNKSIRSFLNDKYSGPVNGTNHEYMMELLKEPTINNDLMYEVALMNK